MDALDRRQAIARRLQQSDKPLSATSLAQQFDVSRQVIVGDIALLRAGGMEISATPRGYLLPQASRGCTRTVATRHENSQMADELNIIVDQGCTVVDVIVDHPIYGQLTGSLNLSNRYEVSQFITSCTQHAAAPLSVLTEGIHLHTILCPDEAAFLRVQQALRELGMLLEE